MLKRAKRWLRIIGLSTALLLSSPLGLANKDHVSRKQQQQYTREVKNIYKYLGLNEKIRKYGNKEIYARMISSKRGPLEEKVEKILERHAADIFSEMFPTESRERKLAIDLTNVPTILVVVKRNGEEVYQKTYNKSFSENTLEKLEDLAEFLGPDAVKELEGKFGEMSDKAVVKKIDKMIAQARKGNNGKLERKYRAFARSLEGTCNTWTNRSSVNRMTDLNRIMRTVGHEYVHILYAGSPLQSRREREQFILIETTCDLLGDEFSSRYAEKYLKKHPEKYKKYLDGIREMERRSRIGRGLIIEADKLLMAGKIDLAEKLMDETAKKMGINEINQANIAIVKGYSGINYVYDELSHMLKELGPDYFVKTIKNVTNFNESNYAYRLMEDINKLDINKLKQDYFENKGAIRKLVANLYPYVARTCSWELRKEFIKKSILEHELYEKMPEKEVAEIVKQG